MITKYRAKLDNPDGIIKAVQVNGETEHTVEFILPNGTRTLNKKIAAFWEYFDTYAEAKTAVSDKLKILASIKKAEWEAYKAKLAWLKKQTGPQPDGLTWDEHQREIAERGGE